MRLRVPDEGATVVHDVIRGDTRFEHVHLDDPVIARSDGSVLYNFAVAIDDLDAGITHVVRGEDHLSNTPKQLLVLEALGAPQPLYAHLPLLHGPDGKKLSKRHGAASVGELREAGYLPEAVRNYLALLGWGTGDDATVLSTEELARRFALERVSRNPAQFDETKLRWMNGLYVRELPPAELARRLAEHIARERPQDAREPRSRDARARGGDQPGEDPDAGGLLAAGGLLLRAARGDRPQGARALAGRARRADAGAGARGARAGDQLRRGRRACRRWRTCRSACRCKPREIYQPLRVALTGTTISPGIFESVALLGREETLSRIDAALGKPS